MDEREPNDKRELLQKLLGLGRSLVGGVASGALQGAANELRDQVPAAFEPQAQALVADTFGALGRLAHSVAESDRTLEQVVRDLSRAGTDGALGELQRQWQGGGLPLHGLLGRMETFVNQAIAVASSRASDMNEPGSRAHKMASSAIQGATEQLHEYLPTIREDLHALVPLGGDIAYGMGRGLLGGLASKIRDDPAALNAIVSELGRAVVRSLAESVETELGTRAHAAPAAISRAAVELAEDAAAAGVRGASRELLEALAALQKQVAPPGALRRIVAETVAGVADALLPRIRRPLFAVAGMGGLVAISMFARRRR